MDKFLKILDFVLVIAAIVLAVYVGKNIGLEYLMRGREEPVTLSMTEGGLPEDYIGRPAGGDIPLIEDGHSWEEAWATDYITIQPVGIAVSYTHLDVYKRQHLSSAVEELPVELVENALFTQIGHIKRH